MAKLTTAILVILERDNKVLFLERIRGWGAGQYSLPGGNVEEDESLTHACVREMYEELRITIAPEDLQFVNLSHIKIPSHSYLLITFVAKQWQGEPVNNEPDKHSDMVWLDINNLPDSLHLHAHETIRCYREKQTFGEYGW